MYNYQTKLTSEEINRLNLVDNSTMRKSLMSVYAYMIKTNKKLNDKYRELNLKKDPLRLKISMRKFLAAYKKYHSIKNLTTLKNRIDKLIELGLITVEKIKNKSVYTFCRFNKKINKKLNKKNVHKTVENASVKKHFKKLKYKSYSIINNFNSNTNREKISSLCECKTIVIKAFKELHVKSIWIKKRVLNKIQKYWNRLYKDAAMSYIYKTIDSARKAYYANYDKYVKPANLYKNRTKQKFSTFNNFKQRSYDFKDLEKKLLGWD